MLWTAFFAHTFYATITWDFWKNDVSNDEAVLNVTDKWRVDSYLHLIDFIKWIIGRE